MGQQLHIQQGASKMPASSPLLLRKLGSVSKKHVFIRSVLLCSVTGQMAPMKRPTDEKEEEEIHKKNWPAVLTSYETSSWEITMYVRSSGSVQIQLENNSFLQRESQTNRATMIPVFERTTNSSNWQKHTEDEAISNTDPCFPSEIWPAGLTVMDKSWWS